MNKEQKVQVPFVSQHNSNEMLAEVPVKQKTIGQLISEAMILHELNPDVVEQKLKFPTGILKRLMDDDFYTNSIPIILFKNLVLSLHIPLEQVSAAMLPTFQLIKSKETEETLKEKSSNYLLWECEEAVIKYRDRLIEIVKQGKGRHFS